MILKQEIEKLKELCDIRTIVEGYGHEIIGGKMCCPFHDDSTPSFSIKRGEQWFYCFGCNVGGDVIKFVQMYEGLTFTQAVIKLAEYVGMSLDLSSCEESIKIREERSKLNQIYLSAAKYCNSVLPDDIRFHLNSVYGFSDEFISRKLIGFDDGKVFETLLRIYPREDLLSTGLFVGDKDFLQSRIVFWYWHNGEPVYAIGRETEYTKALKNYNKYEAGRKYKKLLTWTPERTYVSKEVENRFIYGVDMFSSKSKQPYGVITEGITDAMLAESLGIPVLSPVTKQFRKNDIENLKTITKFLPVVYIVNDNEENGEGMKGALATAKELIGNGPEILITELPRPEGVSKVDLNDVLKAVNSESEFKTILNMHSKKYSDILLGRAIKNGGDYAAIDELLLLSSKMQPLKAELFLKEVSKALKVKLSTLIDQKAILEAAPVKEEKEEDGPELGEFLFEALKKDGAKFYKVGTGDSTDVVMLIGGKKFAIEIKECPFTFLLSDKFNLNILDFEVKKAIFKFKSLAYFESQRMKVQSWLYSEPKVRNEIYMSSGFERNDIVKISPGKVEVIDNGEDDGIFVNDTGPVFFPWNFDPKASKEIIPRLISWYDTLTPCSMEQNLLMLLTVFVQPLKRYVDTKPIIKVSGKTSGGKTAVASTPVRLIYGNLLSIGTMTTPALFAESDKRMITVLDNLESVEGQLLEQYLLFSATGGVRQKVSTANHSQTFQMVDSLPIITAIHPLEKGELVNRSFEISADSHFHKDIKSVIEAEIMFNSYRDQILSVWSLLLSETLQNIDRFLVYKEYLVREYKGLSKSRLNEFFALMWAFADQMLPHAGWTKEEIKRFIEGNITAQSEDGAEQERDISPIFQAFSMLHQRIRTNYNVTTSEGYYDWLSDELESVKIVGRELKVEATSNQLLVVFSRLMKESGQKLPYGSSQTLLNRIKSDIRLLTSVGWEVSLSVKGKEGFRRSKGDVALHSFSCPLNNTVKVVKPWIGEKGEKIDENLG